MSNRRYDCGSFCKIMNFFFLFFVPLRICASKSRHLSRIFSFRLRYVFGKIHPVRIEMFPFRDSALETSTRTLDNTFTHIVNPVLVKSIPGEGLGLCGSFSKDALGYFLKPL